VGTGEPFMSLSAQVWALSLHHCEEALQSASVLQPGMQVPVVVLQIGVVPEHWAEVVHWTQVLVVMLQMGVAPEHCASITHCSQRPMLGPEVAQIFDRHTVSPLLSAQGPSPLA
jgi:hypothetical protein